MIKLSQQHWWEIAESILDDSAGALDPPPFEIETPDADTVILHFADAREETLFRLRWLG